MRSVTTFETDCYVLCSSCLGCRCEEDRGGESGGGSSCSRSKISKVSALLNVPYKMMIEQTFEKFCYLYTAAADVAAATIKDEDQCVWKLLIFLFLDTYMCICVYTCTHMCVYICARMYIRICKHNHQYAQHMNLYMTFSIIYIYIHIYIYTL